MVHGGSDASENRCDATRMVFIKKPGFGDKAGLLVVELAVINFKRWIRLLLPVAQEVGQTLLPLVGAATFILSEEFFPTARALSRDRRQQNCDQTNRLQ